MSTSNTTNMLLGKPTVGNSNGTWGTELNQVIDNIDQAVLSNNFAYNSDLTDGLDFYYKNGRLLKGNTVYKIDGDYVTLTDNTTNYVELSRAGVVSVNAVGFTTSSIPLYEIVTLNGAITTITDSRSYLNHNITEKVSCDTDGSIFIGDGSNHTKFATDGEQSMVGTGRVKKIKRLSARDMSVGTSTPSPVVYGSFLSYSYGIGDNAYNSTVIPDSLDTSGSLDIYAIWYCSEAYATNSGEIKWRIDWSLAAVGEAVNSPGSSGYNETSDINLPGTAYTTVKTLLKSIDTSDISENDILGLKVSRVAISGGNNPSAGEPSILCLDIEYTANKLGQTL